MEDEQRRMVGVVMAGLIVVVGLVVCLGPYLIAYGVPVFVLSLAVGWLWLHGCRGRAPDKRHYARLALLMPATLIAALLVLSALQPETAGASNGAVRHNYSKKALGSTTMLDPWHEGFERARRAWYTGVFGWRLGSEADFGFEHLRWIVLVAVGLGAPLCFGLFYRKDFEACEWARESAASEAEAAREEEFAQERKALTSQIEQLKTREQNILIALSARDSEIQALRLREKYLSEGRPKPLDAGGIEKPNLDLL